jgi:hypothetical protein
MLSAQGAQSYLPEPAGNFNLKQKINGQKISNALVPNYLKQNEKRFHGMPGPDQYHYSNRTVTFGFPLFSGVC